MPIEEIIVTGTRTPAPAGLPPDVVPDYYNTFERDLDQLDAQEAAQEAAREKYLDEIVVTAKKPKPTLLAAALAATRSQMLNIGGRVATATKSTLLTTGIADPHGIAWMLKETQKPIEEIIVKGTRLRTATAFASRLALPITVASEGGKIISMIARELQRQAIDELAEWVLRPEIPKPDTAVRTMPQVKTKADVATSRFPAQQMQEIVVTARRPRALTYAEPAISREQMRSFDLDMLQQTGVGFSAGTITAPTIPQVKTKTRTRTATFPQVRTRTKQLTLPITGTGTRRSTLLGIGTGVATGIATGIATGVGTGVATGVATQSKLAQVTRVGQKTKYCKPRPKKKRTVCWKKLVKEARFESQDKVSKWIKINCDTGRELRKT